MTIFDGLSAFPITPTDPNGTLREAEFAALVAGLAQDGIASVGVLGSTGTYAYLDPAVRAQAIRVAVGAAAGRLPVIAGIGALRTDTACALARDAQAAGADGLLLAPVSYTPLFDAEVFAHFRTVSEATDLPLCIYDNPGTTHFSFSEDLIARLAELPRIGAVKLPLPADGGYAGQIARLRARVPDDFRIGYSGDWGLAAAMLAGADAFFCVAAGLLPKPLAVLCTAAQAGDAEKAHGLDADLAPLWALFRERGSLRVVYAAANLLDLTTAQPPLPVAPIDAAAQARLRAALTALGLMPGR